MPCTDCYRVGIATASYGEATLYQHSNDDLNCYILNGQQRLISITILLSVLRHLARKRYPDETSSILIGKFLPANHFTFADSESTSNITRIHVRGLQQDFYAKYVSPAIDNLGSFWDEKQNLLLELASKDTINRRFMQVAHALKQVLCTVCFTCIVTFQ